MNFNHKTFFLFYQKNDINIYRQMLLSNFKSLRLIYLTLLAK